MPEAPPVEESFDREMIPKPEALQMGNFAAALGEIIFYDAAIAGISTNGSQSAQNIGTEHLLSKVKDLLLIRELLLRRKVSKFPGIIEWNRMDLRGDFMLAPPDRGWPNFYHRQYLTLINVFGFFARHPILSEVESHLKPDWDECIKRCRILLFQCLLTLVQTELGENPNDDGNVF